MFQIVLSRFKRYKYHLCVLILFAAVSIFIYVFNIVVAVYKSYFLKLTSTLTYIPFLTICLGVTFYQIERRKELEMYFYICIFWHRGINYYYLSDFIVYTYACEDNKEDIDDYIKDCILTQFPQFSTDQLNRAYTIFVRYLFYFLFFYWWLNSI